MRPLFLQILSLLCLFFAAPLSFAELTPEEKIKAWSERAKNGSAFYYDEIFDSDGNIREHYKDILPHYLKKSEADLMDIRKGTLKDFRGDNALSAMPRVMLESEYNEIKRGVAQRGAALLRLLKDHYSGEKSYIENKIIPKNVIERIISRTNEHEYEGLINPNRIQFMYGPDIIKDAKGISRVLEDNTNYLGGQGDLLIARESLFKHMPEIKTAIEKESTDLPINYYKDLLKRYRSQMKNPSEKIIIFATTPFPDKEDYRLREIWSSLGVEWVQPKGTKKQLKKHGDGMYLEWTENKKKKSERVGFMIFNSEYQSADPNFPAHKKSILLKMAEEFIGPNPPENIPADQVLGLKNAIRNRMKPNFSKIENILKSKDSYKDIFHRNHVPHLTEAVLSGQLLTNNMPGVEFINDKELNIYVEDLIRFYMKEEPILKNLPTEKLYITRPDGTKIVDEAILKKLSENWDRYVVKVVDGRGGEGVWVGPKISPEERVKLIERLRADTSREIIIQAYSHPSILGNDIVDLRVLSQVGPANKTPEVYVSNIGWTRGVGLEGDGKVNLSAGSAHEVSFIVRKERKMIPQNMSCQENYSHLVR